MTSPYLGVGDDYALLQTRWVKSPHPLVNGNQLAIGNAGCQMRLNRGELYEYIDAAIPCYQVKNSGTQLIIYENSGGWIGDTMMTCDDMQEELIENFTHVENAANSSNSATFLYIDYIFYLLFLRCGTYGNGRKINIGHKKDAMGKIVYVQHTNTSFDH